MNAERIGRISLSKEGRSFQIQVNGVPPDLTRGDEGNFTLHLRLDGAQVAIGFCPVFFQTLAMLTLAQQPTLAPQLNIEGTEAAYRLPAAFLKELDDRALKLLLREVQSEHMAEVLWYMKDADLTRNVCRNMSKGASERLMKDLDSRWHGCNPDAATPENRRSGRLALINLLNITRRLMDEGQIPDCFEERRWEHI